MCKYGMKCYQQSRKHQEMYYHDDGSENTCEDTGKKQNDSVSYAWSGVRNGLT